MASKWELAQARCRGALPEASATSITDEGVGGNMAEDGRGWEEEEEEEVEEEEFEVEGIVEDEIAEERDGLDVGATTPLKRTSGGKFMSSKEKSKCLE